ncbi:MAG TPA: hypothetical protein VH682_23335 [Gemmataceae bacterium]
MSRQPGRPKSTAAGREGPCEPGSLLHRILQFIARRVAKAVEVKSSLSAKGGEGREADLSPLSPLSDEGSPKGSDLD